MFQTTKQILNDKRTTNKMTTLKWQINLQDKGQHISSLVYGCQFLLINSIPIFGVSVPNTPKTDKKSKNRQETRPWWKCRPRSLSNEWPVYIPTHICHLSKVVKLFEGAGYQGLQFWMFFWFTGSLGNHVVKTKDGSWWTDSLTSELKKCKLKQNNHHKSLWSCHSGRVTWLSWFR